MEELNRLLGEVGKGLDFFSKQLDEESLTTEQKESLAESLEKFVDVADAFLSSNCKIDEELKGGDN